MFSFRNGLLACAIALAAASSGASHAGVYHFTVSEGLSNGAMFLARPADPYAGANTARASFTFTGALMFNNSAAQNSSQTGDLNSTFGFSASNVSNYGGTGTVFSNALHATVADFATLGAFLGSSGSASSYQYGSYYTIDLGVLAAGTVLTITHDDGVSVWQGSDRIGSTIDGPTIAVTENVRIGATANTILYFGRQNGSPSVLDVVVAEPASLALLGIGLVLVGGLRHGWRHGNAKGSVPARHAIRFDAILTML